MMLAVHREVAAKRRSAPRRKPAEVETVRVNRLVWKEALRLAQGDPRRIQIVSESEVVVR